MSMITDFVALVGAIVGGRVCPQAFPNKPEAPYITYFRPANTEENTLAKNGGTGNMENTRLQVDVWSERYLEAQDLAEQVRVAMKGWNVSNIKTLEFDAYDEEAELHRVVLEFSVRH